MRFVWVLPTLAMGHAVPTGVKRTHLPVPDEKHEFCGGNKPANELTTCTFVDSMTVCACRGWGGGGGIGGDPPYMLCVAPFLGFVL